MPNIWKPFRCTGYDQSRGGYAVQRLSDGCPCAWFVCEGEAEFCVDAINEECRQKGHTGFSEDEK